MSGTFTEPSASFANTPDVPPHAVPTITHGPLVASAVPGGLKQALASVVPQLPDAVRDSWITALAAPLLRAELTTARRIAAFLGQCAAESGGFRDLEEDLSYSASRLCEVWPSRFPTLAAATPFAFHPEALANLVYAGRMGNGDVQSGDGWHFRGRGLIQLTGRTVYERFATAIGQSLDAATAFAATIAGGAESAAWFWSENSLNPLADVWSIDIITQRINGGMTDADERRRLCTTALGCMEG